MGEGTSYTFNAWDNHSAVLDPVTKEVLQTMGKSSGGDAQQLGR